MFALREYVLTDRGGSWPAGESLLFDPASGEPVAVVRDEPWPEVLERPWPDGVRRRPWLWRLLGVDSHPRQSRTVCRRLADGRPLVRLRRPQPVFNKTVSIFDDADRRVGYCRWGFKGTGPGDEFAVVGVDHVCVAQTRRAGTGVYRVAGSDGGAWATVAGRGERSGSPASCRVTLEWSSSDRERDGVLLLAAVLVLFLPG